MTMMMNPSRQQQLTMQPQQQQQSATMNDFFIFPTSACCPPSPASFTGAGHDHDNQVLDDDVVVPFEVLQQWLVHDDDDNATVRPGDGRSSSGGNKDLSADNSPPAQVATKRRGRKPGPRTDGRPAITHVEAERRLRDKLNRRFCELRAAVPTVSRMDRASLLADAARYIAELRRRVEQLEATKATVTASYPSGGGSSRLLLAEEKLEVRMAGTEAAALRLTTTARHAPARLMDALRSLDLPVQHACVSRVGGVTVLDAVVEVPADALREEAALRAALLHWLQVSAAS